MMRSYSTRQILWISNCVAGAFILLILAGQSGRDLPSSWMTYRIAGLTGRSARTRRNALTSR